MCWIDYKGKWCNFWEASLCDGNRSHLYYGSPVTLLYTPQRCRGRGEAVCCASKLQVILFSSNPSTYLLLIEIALQYSLFPLQSFICLIAEINWKLARYISHREWYVPFNTWYASLERQNTFVMRQATCINCITWYMSRRTYCIIFYLICIRVGWSWARVGSQHLSICNILDLGLCNTTLITKMQNMT